MDTTTEQLLASIKIERNRSKKDYLKDASSRQMAKRIVDLEAENLRLTKRTDIVSLLLAQACDEMEGIFRSTKAFASVEIATNYIVWASYLKHNYGRDDAKCIEDAQEWIEKQ